MLLGSQHTVVQWWDKVSTTADIDGRHLIWLSGPNITRPLWLCQKIYGTFYRFVNTPDFSSLTTSNLVHLTYYGGRQSYFSRSIGLICN
jgi:hypothetical protein